MSRIRVGVIASMVVASLWPAAGDAQQGRIELSPMVGYQWGGGGTISNRDARGDLGVASSVAYGLTADFAVRRGVFVEALVYTQPSDLTFQAIDSPEKETVSGLSTWYFHVGGLYEALNTGMAKPFVVLSLGATQMIPDRAGVGSEWFFSFAVGGGVKAWVSERVAIRAQIRGWFTALSSSTGFFIGPGGGGVSTWIGDISSQGELSGGLSFAL